MNARMSSWLITGMLAEGVEVSLNNTKHCLRAGQGTQSAPRGYQVEEAVLHDAGFAEPAMLGAAGSCRVGGLLRLWQDNAAGRGDEGLRAQSSRCRGH